MSIELRCRRVKQVGLVEGNGSVEGLIRHKGTESYCNEMRGMER